MFYIYILYSKSSDKYYVGHTDDPYRRLEEHNTSEKTTYTHKHRPWKMVSLFEVIGGRGDAMKIEKFIKKQKSREFIERLVTQDKLDGSLGQLVRVPKLRD
jgi:putative endonuclease